MPGAHIYTAYPNDTCTISTSTSNPASQRAVSRSLLPLCFPFLSISSVKGKITDHFESHFDLNDHKIDDVVKSVHNVLFWRSSPLQCPIWMVAKESKRGILKESIANKRNTTEPHACYFPNIRLVSQLYTLVWGEIWGETGRSRTLLSLEVSGAKKYVSTVITFKVQRPLYWQGSAKPALGLGHG